LKDVIASYIDAGASHISLYPIDASEAYSAGQVGGFSWDWPMLEALAPK